MSELGRPKLSYAAWPAIVRLARFLGLRVGDGPVTPTRNARLVEAVARRCQ